MPGQLFTHYFLNDGIRATPEWRDSGPAVSAFRERAAWIYEGFKAYHAPNEAVTEQDLVRPILEARGWAGYLPQQGSPYCSLKDNFRREHSLSFRPGR